MLYFQSRKMFKAVRRLLSKPCLLHHSNYSNTAVVEPLRVRKPKSHKSASKRFVDAKRVRAVGGTGGDGAVSFLHLWSNEFAGPDGGDGGHGAHVLFEASFDVTDLSRVPTVVRGAPGEPGQGRDCHGKSAPHEVVQVPVGTVVKSRAGEVVVGDLSEGGLVFIGARGGAGGKGNHFFVTDVEQAPKIAEYGAQGETNEYLLEVRSMAHVGLIGFPNAGKSTLLRAISRAKPKVASYPFTTLHPYIGMIQYSDYEQLAVADLPGLIPDSHKNKGLGIQFLKHVERCTALLYVIDVSLDKPWTYLSILQEELLKFNPSLQNRSAMVVANKIDLLNSEDGNVEELRLHTDLPVIPVSAKKGENVKQLLMEIRKMYDENKVEEAD